MSSNQCIYCGRFFNPRCGTGDHILAASVFGEFAGDKHFRGICRKCNNACSPFEQLLAQATPIGYLRSIVKPRRRGRQSGLRQHGGRGCKPPRSIVWLGNRGELVEPHEDDPRTVTPIDHLTIVDDADNEEYVRLYPRMSLKRLKKEIENCGINKPQSIYCSCSHGEREHYAALLEELYPSHHRENLPDTGPLIAHARGRTVFVFSLEVFRGIAKIAFHYYLVHNRRGYRGNEPEFSGIRRYIRQGGKFERFFEQRGPKFLPLAGVPSGQTLADWCHVFGVHEVDKSVVVNMLLFAGPEYSGDAHQVTLGRINSKLILPSGMWGHVYRYQPNRNDSFSGKVEDAPWKQLF